VEEQSIETIVGKIEANAKTDKNYIIEGFPKNLRQALSLQKRGIYAKNVLVINIDDQGLSEILRKKLAQLNPKLPADQLSPLVEAARMEHRMYCSPHAATSTRSRTSTGSTWKSTSPSGGRSPS
jgi:adenylate kinase family enzyme